MRKIYFLLPLILLIHLVLLILLRFTAWPEMILWPYLMQKGLVLYHDIVIIYTPSLLLLLGFLGKLFGVTLLNLKIETWLLIIITDLIVYLVSVKIFKKQMIGIISLLFFIIWQPYFNGNALWFELILAPLGLSIFYFQYFKKYFLAGLILGLALTIKQTSVWFIFPVLITLLVCKELSWKSIFKLIFGTTVFLLLNYFYLLSNNLLGDFWKWAIDFGIFYLPRDKGQVLLPTIKQLVSALIPYSILLIGLPIFLKKNSEKKILLILIIWCGFSALGIYPRWELFHLQPSLPFLSILFGYFAFNFYYFLSYQDKRKKIIFCFLCGVVAIGFLRIQLRFYELNWQKPTRFFEEDVLEISGWIRDNTKRGEQIYILNSWDHIYALSETMPAVSPLIHTLPWHLEYPGMQEKYTLDLEKNRPRLIIFQPYSKTGLGSYKPQMIDDFLQQRYIKTKIIADRFWIYELK